MKVRNDEKLDSRHENISIFHKKTFWFYHNTLKRNSLQTRHTQTISRLKKYPTYNSRSYLVLLPHPVNMCIKKGENVFTPIK